MLRRTKLWISILISALVLALVGVISFYIYENKTSVQDWYKGESGDASGLIKDNHVLIGLVDRSITKITAKDLEGVTVIGESAFRDCPNLHEVELPEGVTSINTSAFYGCANLFSMTLPSTLTRIDSGAFTGCYRLVELYNFSDIPVVAGESSVDNGHIGQYLLKIHEKSEESNIQVIDDVFYFVDNANKVVLGAKDSTLTEYKIAEDTTAIGDHAFYQYANLQSINIPKTLKSIGPSAFNSCQLMSFTFPESLEAVGVSAFGNCYKLVELYNFSEIPVRAGAATDSTLNGNIGRNLLKVHEVQEPSCVKTINGVYYFVDADEKIIIGASSKTAATYTLDNDSTKILAYAFDGYENLKSIDIPSSVKVIGQYAFRGCTNLTELTLHEGIEEIETGAFTQCPKITKIFLPNTITLLGTNRTGSNVFNVTMPELQEIKIDCALGYTGMLTSSLLRSLPAECNIYVLKTIVDDGNNRNTALTSYSKTESGEYYLFKAN